MPKLKKYARRNNMNNEKTNKYEQKSFEKKVNIQNIHSGISSFISVRDALTAVQQALNSGAFEYMLVVCEKIIQVSPKLPQAHLFLARAHMRMGSRKLAKLIISKVLTMRELSAENIVHAGHILGDLYDTEQSFALIERAYKLSPDNAQILTFYATMLIQKGRSDEAVKCLKRSIKINPQYAGTYLMLALESPNNIDDSMLESINKLIFHAQDNSVRKAVLLFSVAKKYAQLGDIPSEFSCLDRANQTIRKRYNWTWKNDLRDWQEISEKFTPQFIGKIKKTGNKNLNPIIFATLPRSGTTLAEKIISSHSQVCAAGESNLFQGSAIESAMEYGRDNRYWNVINEKNAGNYLQKYEQKVFECMNDQNLHKKFVTDKSINNFYSIGIILSAFPQAKAIHCVRDPLDICLSCYQHYFIDGLPYTCNLEDMARICNLFDEVMGYWQQIFHDRILILKYSDLVINPEDNVRRVLEFLDLPWEDSCLKFFENKNIVHTASVKQVQSPINTKGLNRWKKYEAYLQPAIATLKKGLVD
jgi:tetratricopeptide (TPR) repeat protein